MCLGVPGKVVLVEGNEAVVDFWGLTRRVRLDIVDAPVAPGDYVLNHVGYAIRRIPDAEIRETLSLYEQLLEEAKKNEDLMAADIRGEIAAGAGSAASEASPPPGEPGAGKKSGGLPDER